MPGFREHTRATEDECKKTHSLRLYVETTRESISRSPAGFVTRRWVHSRDHEIKRMGLLKQSAYLFGFKLFF